MASILRSAMGEVGFRAVLAVVMVSFISLLSQHAGGGQPSVVRLCAGPDDRWQRPVQPDLAAYARAGRGLGGGGGDSGAHLPMWAVAAECGQHHHQSASGDLHALQMLVAGALIARAQGWKPAGPFTLGRWGWLVNVIGLAYGLSAIVDMVWPRSPNDPWYSNYGMIVTAVGVLVLGTIYMVVGRPYDHGTALAGMRRGWVSFGAAVG